MKVIGRNLSGGVLMEVSLEEYSALMAASIALAGLPELTVPAPMQPPVPSSCDTAQPLERLIARANTKATKPDKSKTSRPCAWCRKPLPANSNLNRKTHVGKCTELYRRKQGRESWRKRHGCKNPRQNLIEPPKQTINPADPNLTDEQRLAARLEIIKRSAQAHAND